MLLMYWSFYKFNFNYMQIVICFVIFFSKIIRGRLGKKIKFVVNFMYEEQDLSFIMVIQFRNDYVYLYVDICSQSDYDIVIREFDFF